MHIPFRESEMMKMTYCLGYWMPEATPFNQEISERRERLDWIVPPRIGWQMRQSMVRMCREANTGRR